VSGGRVQPKQYTEFPSISLGVWGGGGRGQPKQQHSESLNISVGVWALGGGHSLNNTLSFPASVWMSGGRGQLKGTVSRDFLVLVFFMNQFPPSP
jgi:hypothetical protein